MKKIREPALKDRDEIFTRVYACNPDESEPKWGVFDEQGLLAYGGDFAEAEEYRMELRHQCAFGTFDGWSSDELAEMVMEAQTLGVSDKEIITQLVDFHRANEEVAHEAAKHFAKNIDIEEHTCQH